MKSRQINFFITPEDNKNINKFLEEMDCIIMVEKYIAVGKNPTFELPDKSEDIFKVFLTKNEFLNDIKITESNDSKYFDSSRSPLLEFPLGGFYPYNRKILQRARFYFELGDYDNNDIFILKSDVFINWSTNIMSNFKKRFLKKYVQGDPIYYSASAIHWIEENNAIFADSGQSWKA